MGKNKSKMFDTMEIVEMELSTMTPADYNPRMITEKSRKGLKSSIERWGCVEPIIYNKRTDNIVGGHQRFDILLEEGVKKTQVVVIDISENDEKALNLSLNNPHIAGEFTDGLQAVLDDLKIEVGDDFENLELDMLSIPDFEMFDKPDGRLDVKKIVKCPECGHEF